MEKGLKAVGRVVQVAITTLLALVLAGNVYLLAARHFLGVEYPSLLGFSTAVVVSGSMEPTLSVDDLIIIHREPDYTPGDVITFRSGDSLVTHRIVEETPDGFVTQGDANNAPDAQPVSPEDIQGRVMAHLPYVGLVTGYLKTPLGMTLLVFAGLLLIELPILLRWRQEETEEGGSDHGT